MGWRKLSALESVWREKRDKFSTCWIDYQPEPLVRNLPEYFKWGRCGMCSGFFTGNGHYMKAFCDAMEAKFLTTLEAGYGHADEQLFSMVYFDDKSIFDVYYGDYREMVSNYVAPVDKPYEPVRLLVAHALDHGDAEAAARGAMAVWEAWKEGAAPLDNGQLAELVRLLREARRRLGQGEILP